MPEAIVSTARLQVRFEATEVLQGVPGAVGTPVPNDDFNHQPHDFSPTSDPAVSRASYQTYAIGGGGTTDIDLTALLATQTAINGTGLKVQGLYVKNLGVNVMTVGPGAANDYAPFGAGKSVDLPATASRKSELLFFAPELLADIAAGDRLIRLTGTAGDTANVGFWLG